MILSSAWYVFYIIILSSTCANKLLSQCQQRLSQWRNKMGSAGLVIVNSLLNSIDVNEPENNLDTNEKRQDYCQDLLDDLKFVWAEWVSKEVRTSIIFVLITYKLF